MKRPRKPTKAERTIMEAAGYDSECYAVMGDHNGLLIIVSRSDDRNIVRIDTNTKKRIPG
jgi:hypothetical protein